MRQFRNDSGVYRVVCRSSLRWTGCTEDMLVKILKEPKNAILKQYQKLLALDEVKLEFEEGALTCHS